ncbi:FAD-dependent monooxygenase [Nocardia panacis]|uniref:FAD-dependent monooxygenase n=1 Tax=Nocardia panacis TaxID=2340916 RepID=A0A3A4KJ02_9NOCA|nr:FAD-dependent monooxygenase [Nocardia panacis]RJO74852.1 FAD-dependent monooxygenase [Nocardia panacis]
MHVIIIGGGTGGMCLAHGLKNAGVSVAVYERYGTRKDGLYGYRVGIDATGSRSLEQCLSPELYRTFVATCARTPRYFNVLTEKMRATTNIALGSLGDGEHSVSRSTLRQVLFTGMDDVVHYGKTFTHYTQHPDGTVTAHFDDGTSADGDVLVSAEGTRSAIRRQYLPHAEVKDTGITALATKTPLTPEIRALLSEEIEQGISLIFAKGGLMGMLHVMEFPWDVEGKPKDDRDTDLLSVWDGLQYDNTRDYVNLSVWGAHDHFPEGVHELRGEELIKVALASTADWDPKLRKMFELSDPASAFPLRIATSVPIEAWQPTNITLLGDAIHTMTPGQGVGANTALRDAALLCGQLTAAARGDRELITAIGEYEAEIVPYGFARVADSLKQNGTRGDDPLYRPFVGRLALFAARTYFSLTGSIPSLRRKFLAEMQAYRGE